MYLVYHRSSKSLGYC